MMCGCLRRHKKPFSPLAQSPLGTVRAAWENHNKVDLGKMNLGIIIKGKAMTSLAGFRYTNLTSNMQPEVSTHSLKVARKSFPMFSVASMSWFLWNSQNQADQSLQYVVLFLGQISPV